MRTQQVLPIARLGERILSQSAAPVNKADILKCIPFAEQMLFTLDSIGERIGLAAPQVFIDKRIIIFRIPLTTHNRYQLNSKQEEVPFTVMINPVWTPINDTQEDGWEACISLPNLMGVVPRYTNISYEYYDLEGKLNKRNASGFHSRVIQHECDHLDGFVYTQRMKDLHTLTFEDVKLKNDQYTSTMTA